MNKQMDKATDISTSTTDLDFFGQVEVQFTSNNWTQVAF